MPRPNDKKKGIFSRMLHKQSPEEADRARIRNSVDALQAEREEVLDSRRELKGKIDRFTDRARSKKQEVDAASGPKKKILDRELRAILRPLQAVVKEDTRLDTRLTQLDTLLDKARETLAVKTSGITEEVIENLIDAAQEAIAAEEEREELVGELKEMEYEGAAEEISTDDMLADLGMDMGEEEVRETTPPQVERTPQREETVRQPDTTERISEGKRELDRLMAELDEEDD